MSVNIKGLSNRIEMNTSMLFKLNEHKWHAFESWSEGIRVALGFAGLVWTLDSSKRREHEHPNLLKFWDMAHYDARIIMWSTVIDYNLRSDILEAGPAYEAFDFVRKACDVKKEG